MKKTWAFTWHVLFFASGAFAAPFVVPYYQKLGFSGAQIGLLVGLARSSRCLHHRRAQASPTRPGGTGSS